MLHLFVVASWVRFGGVAGHKVALHPRVNLALSTCQRLVHLAHLRRGSCPSNGLVVDVGGLIVSVGANVRVVVAVAQATKLQPHQNLVKVGVMCLVGIAVGAGVAVTALDRG